MTVMVAFDGSPLSLAALSRAAEYGEAMDEAVVAVAVVPGDSAYACDRGWIDADDEREFDPDEVVERLRERAESVAPAAEFPAERVAEYAGAHTIASRLGQVTRELDPSVAFLGSENAGKIVTPISSVGSRLASDRRYDVYLVRHPGEE